MKRVMIVEDETLVAMEIAEAVREYGFEVVATCMDASCAIQTAEETSPDLILMDIRIKGDRDGIETAKTILQSHTPAIVFLTAFSDQKHIERAISLSPLGYLIKPIRTAELNALLKMAELQQDNTLRGDLLLDAHFSIESDTALLIKDGRYVTLTRKEHQLLQLLIHHKNAIVSIYDIELTIWPEKTPNDSTRRSLINRLRSKLDNRFLETIHGEGYRLNF